MYNNYLYTKQFNLITKRIATCMVVHLYLTYWNMFLFVKGLKALPVMIVLWHLWKAWTSHQWAKEQRVLTLKIRTSCKDWSFLTLKMVTTAQQNHCTWLVQDSQTKGKGITLVKTNSQELHSHCQLKQTQNWVVTSWEKHRNNLKIWCLHPVTQACQMTSKCLTVQKQMIWT